MNRFLLRGATAAFACAAALCRTGEAHAQQTVIGSGGVTVKNANGTTTRITNGGIVTSGKQGKSPKMRRVQVLTGTQSGSATISGNHRTVTVTAKNSVVSITGNDNNVTITGNSARVSVAGNHNTVRIERAADIVASGNNNRITWRTSPNRGGIPRITQTGNKNTVSRR